MSAPQSPPPGWYPDPQAAGTERWWDGTQWGAQTRPSMAKPAEPQATFTPGQEAPHTPGFTPADGQHQATFTPGAAPFGGGAPTGVMPASDVKTWSILAHVSALLTALVGFAFVGPLVIYLIKRDEDAMVRAQSAAALNFQLSWLIWGIGLGIITFILMLVFIGVLLIPVLLAGAVAWFVFTILGAVKASNGELYKFPLTIDFVS